jgi:hypothetical protein
MKRALVVLGSVAIVALVLGVLLRLGCKGISTREPTEEEMQLLIPVSRLEPLGVTGLNPGACESVIAKRNLDGSLELEYEYDSERAPESSRFLFYKSEAEISDSAEDARESHMLQVAAYKAGTMLVKGRKLERSSASFSVGEQNYLGTVTQDGKPLGTVAVVRQGTIVHSVLILGLYFDDPEQLKTLLKPVLAKSLEMSLR